MKIIYYMGILLVLLASCKEQQEEKEGVTTAPAAKAYTYTPGQDYKDYWFNGTAEISSYALSQSRYGEMRPGQAVLIFVTEPFSSSSNTKADNPGPGDPTVLKLNFTKDFKTGIYPYHMMNSSFFPFEDGQHALKLATSTQEWCGMTYMELQAGEHFSIDINSYFEGESKTGLKLEKAVLEDDIWSMIRLQPDNLPEGEFDAIPGFFYLRLKHVPAKAYKATASRTLTDSSTSRYTISYPALKRRLTIEYESDFPHQILGWNEQYPDTNGSDSISETTGELIKSIRSDYWRRNSNKDLVLRDSLGLE